MGWGKQVPWGWGALCIVIVWKYHNSAVPFRLLNEIGRRIESAFFSSGFSCSGPASSYCSRSFNWLSRISKKEIHAWGKKELFCSRDRRFSDIASLAFFFSSGVSHAIWQQNMSEKTVWIAPPSPNSPGIVKCVGLWRSHRRGHLLAAALWGCYVS